MRFTTSAGLRLCQKCDDSVGALGRCSHRRSPSPARRSHPRGTTTLNPPGKRPTGGARRCSTLRPHRTLIPSIFIDELIAHSVGDTPVSCRERCPRGDKAALAARVATDVRFATGGARRSVAHPARCRCGERCDEMRGARGKGVSTVLACVGPRRCDGRRSEEILRRSCNPHRTDTTSDEGWLR